MTSYQDDLILRDRLDRAIDLLFVDAVRVERIKVELRRPTSASPVHDERADMRSALLTEIVVRPSLDLLDAADLLIHSKSDDTIKVAVVVRRAVLTSMLRRRSVSDMFKTLCVTSSETILMDDETALRDARSKAVQALDRAEWEMGTIVPMNIKRR